MNLNKLKDLAVDAAKKAGLFLIENKVKEKKNTFRRWQRHKINS